MPEVHSVGTLVARLRHSVESTGTDLWVKGEVSYFKPYGHWYFTLKDEDARLECVMWKSGVRNVGFMPEVGTLVLLRGSPTVYVKEGRLQFMARELLPAGEGALQKAFEALKARLEREGLFALSRKRPLPRIPAVVGLVTSAESAALRDIVAILRQRFAPARIVLRSVRVQGPLAAAEIAGAIQAFSDIPISLAGRPDVLIIGRGGGSPEDLWAFNEEVVARALFACTIPTITGIGHETDHSIADHVADRRAATPSNAAEIAVPVARDIARWVLERAHGLDATMVGRIRERRLAIQRIVESNRFNQPVRRLGDRRQDLDRLMEGLMKRGLHRMQRARLAVTALQGRLETLDPRRALRRGFIRVERGGQRIRAAAELAVMDRVELLFADGSVPAEIIDGRPDAAPPT